MIDLQRGALRKIAVSVRSPGEDCSVVGDHDKRLDQKRPTEKGIAVRDNSGWIIRTCAVGVGHCKTAGSGATACGVKRGDPSTLIIGYEKWIAGQERNAPGIDEWRNEVVRDIRKI